MFFRKYRLPLLAVTLLLLAGLWYAFRPEKLFLNQRVHEAAPAGISSSESTLVSSAKLTGNVHDTSGRASVYKSPDGSSVLRLTSFSTSNGPDVHVVLVSANDPAVTAKSPGVSPRSLVELGPLKGNQGDQNYGIPTGTDLNANNAVLIYCERFHAVFGSGKLEAF